MTNSIFGSAVSDTSTAPRLDVRSHFGLHATPFTRELDIGKRWRHPQYEEVRVDLRGVVEQRQSGALIAPAGTGKTALLRGLVAELPEARYRVHYVKVTDLSKRDLCREVALALGCEPAGFFGALVAKVQGRCQALLEQDSLRPVLIIDEAHEIRPHVLGVLRVLTNFEMDSKLVISVLLVGQPPLRELLRREELEAVSRRLSHYAILRLLSRDESRAYVQHRLDIVGARQALFDDQAYDAIYEAAQGNLRATDCLALKALEEAARLTLPIVGAELVVRARQKVWP